MRCLFMALVGAIIFSSSVAVNAQEQSEHEFFLGILVGDLSTGTQHLIIGNILAGHGGLFAAAEGTGLYSRDNSRILWAGEIERRVSDGKISRVNSTASIVVEMPRLAPGLKDDPALGIKNLKIFLIRNKKIKDRLFSDTTFYDYSTNYEHLDEKLRGVSDLRHNFLSDAGSAFFFLDFLSQVQEESIGRKVDKEREMSDKAREKTIKALDTFEAAIKLRPDLATKEFEELRPYFEAIIEGKVPVWSKDGLRLFIDNGLEKYRPFISVLNEQLNEASTELTILSSTKNTPVRSTYKPLTEDKALSMLLAYSNDTSAKDLDSQLRLLVMELAEKGTFIEEDIMEFLFGKTKDENLYNFISRAPRTEIRDTFLVVAGALAMNDAFFAWITLDDAKLIKTVYQDLGLVAEGTTMINSTLLNKIITSVVKNKRVDISISKGVENIVKF